MSSASPHWRWWAKKLARACVAAGARPFLPRTGLRVLTYHRFGSVARDAFVVSAEAFSAQMAHLAERGTALSLPEFVAAAGLPEPTTPPARSRVLVTIDDADASVAQIAMPILQRYKIPAVLYVPTDFPDGSSGVEPGTGVMSWDDIRAFATNGRTIGSHGCSHRSLTQLPSAAQLDELQRSKAMLEQELQQPVATLAYPYGTFVDFSSATVAAAAQAGYELAFTAVHGCISSATCSYALPRIKVEGGDSLGHFIHLLDGAMDSWRFIDQHLTMLQQTPNANSKRAKP